MSLANLRLDLHDKLVAALGSNNVYYQPPADISMSYPCVVYHFDDDVTLHANNSPYWKYYTFTATLITKDPLPSEFLDVMSDMEYASFERHYTADNLHHFSYKIHLNERIPNG